MGCQLVLFFTCCIEYVIEMYIFVGFFFHAERKLGLRDDLTKLGSLLEGLAGSWQRLGLLLGFPNDTLEQIASTPSDPRVYVNKILMNWLSGDVDSPTVAVLVKALTTMSGMEDIIRNILEGIYKSASYLAYHCNIFSITENFLYSSQHGTGCCC